MKTRKFTLKKDHRGVKAGRFTHILEEDMEFFQEEKMQTFYAQDNPDTRFVSLDVSDKELFTEEVVEYPEVTVKDLIEYIQKNFNMDDRVSLDKDGWMETQICPKDVDELIRNRGLFYKMNGVLGINN